MKTKIDCVTVMNIITVADISFLNGREHVRHNN